MSGCALHTIICFAFRIFTRIENFRVSKIYFCTRGRFDKIALKGRKMSEQEKKETHKGVRIISYIALIVGVATLFCGLLMVPAAGLGAINPTAFMSERFDLLADVAYYSGLSFKYIFAISWTLSIVTLFIERNKYYRLLPLAFVLIGVFLYLMCYVIVTVTR